jgi:hypothetical protein
LSNDAAVCNSGSRDCEIDSDLDDEESDESTVAHEGTVTNSPSDVLAPADTYVIYFDLPEY